MRPLRALRELRRIENRLWTSNAFQSTVRRRLPFRNGYCSACDPAVDPGTTTTSPPLPKSLAADHRELGLQLELFVTSKYSPGSPLFLPHGTKVFNRLTDFLRAQYERFGFQEVITPSIYKKSLWEKSGHWENYADDMYSVIGRGASGTKEGQQVGEDEEYGLKPMNCPGHCLLFSSKRRSYRELPIRYADFGPLHRNEVHGSLSGLTRTRRFHQDDGHIFCRPIQIRDEISKTLKFVRLAYRVLGLGSYRLALSTRPSENFIGSVEEWDNAEAALKESLNESGLAWTLNEGDGAFYGPKIDIILKDSDGKEHQTATIQLDFQLPKRFGLEYQAPAPEQEQKGITTFDPDLLATEGSVTPVMIHRAVLGSVERMMALLIENYGNQWPFWLNPRQLVILTVNDSPEVVEYARKCSSIIRRLTDDEEAIDLDNTRILVDIDQRPINIKRKIAEARKLRYSVIAIVGSRDIRHQTLGVDFSHLPSRCSDLKKNGILRNAFHRQLVYEGARQLPDPLPNLTAEQLKNVNMQVGWLKKALRDFQKSYL